MKKIIEKTCLGLLAVLGMSSCNRTKTDVQGDVTMPRGKQNKTEEFRCIYGGPDMMFRKLNTPEPETIKENTAPKEHTTETD